MEEKKFTGINRILKSEFVQALLDKMRDGTFREFLDDWKWIFQFSKRYKWIVIFYTFLGVFSSTFSLGTAYVSRLLINIIVEKRTDQLPLLIGLVVLSTALALAFNSVMSRVSTRISIYVHNDIQAEIFDKIIDARWEELNNYQNGDLLNRFNSDVSTISSNAISWIPNLAINLYTFAMTFFVLMRMDPTMAWIAILSALPTCTATLTLLPQGEADAQKQQGSQKQHQQGRPASSQPAEYAFFGDGFFHTAPSFSGEIHLQLHHTA